MHEQSKEKTNMKPTVFTWIATMTLFTSLAVAVGAVAQEQSATQEQTPKPTRYTIIDLGTLDGGTFSQPFFINRNGTVSGSATLPDGTQKAILWHKGRMKDIGTLGLGGPNSIAFGDNESDQAV